MTTKTHRTGNNLHHTTKRLIGLSENTLNRFDDAVESLQEQSKRYVNKAEKYVLHNPSKSVGIAFLAGIGFFVLLRGLFKK